MLSMSPIIVSDDCFSVHSDLYPYSVYTCDYLEGKGRHSLSRIIPFPPTDGSLPPYPYLSSVPTVEFPHHQSLIHEPDTKSTYTATPSRLRALTDPLGRHQHEMTTFVQAPGSPPELTNSKSSKSSSFQSSSLSVADDILSDLSHFEDIGLNDDHPASSQDLDGRNRPSNIKTLSFTRLSPTLNGNKRNTTVTSGARELVNGTNRPAYPSLQGPISYAVGPTATHSLSLPMKPGPRRGMATPSTSSLALTAVRNRSRSRSPSPTHAQTLPSSPRSIHGNTSSLRPLTLGRKSTSRPGSWQPSRKTAKELEDEYHDSDEDLPDDASLWNVPLSPGLYREASTAANSVEASPSTSPERANHYGQLDHNITRSIHTAPATSQPFQGTLASIPSSPMKSDIPRGNSTGTLPDHFHFSKHRAKSWTVALSELSEEALSISEALEAHVAEEVRRNEDTNHTGASAFRPSLERLTGSRTSTVELPPLRKSEVMIDPLPVSKEKEKVLSRTRPSWLPPKNRKEEKKHIKEYQRMMEQSLEAEKKKAAKAASVQCARDDTKATLLRIWEEHVIPNWDQAVREPRTRELWWRGIAPCSRAEVWQRAIGNELVLTEATFAKALQRAKAVDKEIRSQKSGEERKEKLWFDAIRRDVAATFPDLKMFQLGRPLHGALTDLLMAYTMYRSDVGYSHGTHLLSALLLLNIPTPSLAFILLANLFNRPLPLAFLTGDAVGTSKTYALTTQLLATKFPKLHTHLFSTLALPPEAVLEPMLRTLFLRGSSSVATDYFAGGASPGAPISPASGAPVGPTGGLSLELVSRIWDVIVFDGDAMVIRTCIAILGYLESGLYGSREEILAVLGWEGGIGGQGLGLGDVEEDEFMGLVREVGKEERRKS